MCQHCVRTPHRTIFLPEPPSPSLAIEPLVLTEDSLRFAEPLVLTEDNLRFAEELRWWEEHRERIVAEIMRHACVPSRFLVMR